MLTAIDQALAHLDKKEKSVTDPKKIFEGFDPARYEALAKLRETAAYKESFARLQNYPPDVLEKFKAAGPSAVFWDYARRQNYPPGAWEKFNAERDAVYLDAAKVMTSGKRPADKAAMDVAERHRLLIDRWFYRCGKDEHCKIAGLYETDSRLAENIDKYGAGLAPFFAAAIRANAKRK